MIRWFSSLAVAAVFLPNVFGLDVEVSSIRCESRAIRAEFSYICDGDFTCRFGEEASMEGDLIYYGLVDTHGLDGDSNMYLDAHLDVNLAGSTQTYTILDQVAMPICSGYLSADQSNVNGDCPADGVYYFKTSYMVPSLDSSLMDWAATGWNGEIVLEMYSGLNHTNPIGKCYMDIQTHVTGLKEKGFLRTVPSARTVMWALFGVGVLLFISCLYCCFARGRGKGEDANPNTFTRMRNNGYPA